jgi:predicted anti-sigma-YlaC factor YlaD
MPTVEPAGNQRRVPSDLFGMSGCGRCRDLLSAELDGETVEGTGWVTGSSDEAHQHLRDCPDCAAWFTRVTQVNRLLRTAPAEPGPGLSADRLAHVLDQLPHPPSRLRAPVRRVARVVLAAVGAAQALVGVLPLLLPGATRMDPHAAMAGPGMGSAMVHMSHEYSAWNLALGVSFLVGARWTRHLAGALPVLVSFVAVLTTVSVIDLLDGRVDLARVVSHALVLFGVGLIVLIVRTTAPEPTVRPGLAHPAEPGPSTGAERATDHPGIDLGGPAERGGPSPAAHRRAA